MLGQGTDEGQGYADAPPSRGRKRARDLLSTLGVVGAAALGVTLVVGPITSDLPDIVAPARLASEAATAAEAPSGAVAVEIRDGVRAPRRATSTVAALDLSLAPVSDRRPSAPRAAVPRRLAATGVLATGPVAAAVTLPAADVAPVEASSPPVEAVADAGVVTASSASTPMVAAASASVEASSAASVSAPRPTARAASRGAAPAREARVRGWGAVRASAVRSEAPAAAAKATEKSAAGGHSATPNEHAAGRPRK